MRCPLIEVWDRRRFLTGIGLGASAFLTPGVFAEALQATPSQAEGPFFPDKLPLDTDNDLVIVGDQLTPAVGQVTYLRGTVRDLHGQAIKNALVEIWQVDGKGVYLHSAAPKEGQDQNFQGYGKFLTDSKGAYYFRTVKPVSYPGRAPHIHIAVSQKGRRLFTSQCYVADEKANRNDFLYQQLEAKERKHVTVQFNPLPKSPTQELVARWDLVIGLTPQK